MQPATYVEEICSRANMRLGNRQDGCPQTPTVSDVPCNTTAWTFKVSPPVVVGVEDGRARREKKVSNRGNKVYVTVDLSREHLQVIWVHVRSL